MSNDRAGRPRRRGQGSNPTHSGPWNGWNDRGPVVRKKPLVRRVTHDNGTKGVIKLAPPTGQENVRQGRRPSWKATRRFYYEVTRMTTLSRDPGVLPVIDYDAASVPGWFVMPRAVLLTAGFGADPAFHEVVVAVRQIANTLARLGREEQIAHRDLKPDNLFWYQEGAVVGDFGIAAWPDREPLTSTGEKVGSVAFLAPEMIRYTKSRDRQRRDRQADVWSLAKVLFVLARPGLGKLPPAGTHRTLDEQFSLYPAGGPAADSIARLVEAATNLNPSRRPSMAEFADELGHWLDVHPNPVEKPARNPRGVATGWRALRGPLQELAEARRHLKDDLSEAMTILSVTVTGMPHAWRVDHNDNRFPPTLIGNHGLRPNCEDGFVADEMICYALPLAKGRRVVLGAVLVAGIVTGLAEVQRLAPAGPVVEQLWRVPDAHAGLPGVQRQLSELVERVAGWLARNA